jgi:hypothetical protein
VTTVRGTIASLMTRLLSAIASNLMPHTQTT